MAIVISGGSSSQDVVSFIEVRADKAVDQSFNRGGLCRLEDSRCFTSSWTLLQKQTRYITIHTEYILNILLLQKARQEYSDVLLRSHHENVVAEVGMRYVTANANT